MRWQISLIMKDLAMTQKRRHKDVSKEFGSEGTL